MKTFLCNPNGFREQIALLAKGDRDEFFNWFDGPKYGTTDEVFEKGEDVFKRLFLPWAEKVLGSDLSKKTSLDWGYGSGAQVLAASKFFKKSYGYDVHDQEELVGEELSKRDSGNIELISGDGIKTKLLNGRADFIHSWTTFMHVGTIDNVKAILKEMRRVMKKGGVGVIFFSRLIRSGKSQTMQQWEADMLIEKKTPPGFREGGPKSKVKSINLQMAMWFMEGLLEETGFQLIAKTVSHDMVGRNAVCHGQHGVVFGR